jgi:hypothetical protein
MLPEVHELPGLLEAELRELAGGGVTARAQQRV